MPTLDLVLPSGLIPSAPSRERGRSRLMIVSKSKGTFTHWRFADLPAFLGDEPVYVNNSRIKSTLSRGDDDPHQPVYSEIEGGTATPCAGLDFTWAVLEQLKIQKLTLHASVWGNESPPAESYSIPDPPHESVIACGTTVVRALETYARTKKTYGWTDLFIHEPFLFKLTRGLITKFHDPRDCHTRLVTAFLGRSLMDEAFRKAIEQKYLFLTYGDAMLVLP